MAEKPKFDPNKPYQPLTPESDNSVLTGVGNTAQDIGLGAAQGLTFGAAPAVAGVIGAAGAKLSGDDAELADLYQKYQALAKAKINESKERSPILFTGSEIVGAAAPAVLASGGALAAKGLSGLASAVGRGAASGALTGAIGGAAESEGKLIGGSEEDRQKVLDDALKGAKFGGAIGGGLGGALNVGGKALEKLSPTLNDSRFLRQLKMAKDEGKAGKSFYGEKALEQRRNEEVKFAEDIADKLAKPMSGADPTQSLSMKSQLGKNIQNTIDEATKNKVLLNNPSEAMLSSVDDLASLMENEKNLFGGSVKTGKIKGSLDRLRTGELTPAEAYDLRKTINNAFTNTDVRTNGILSEFKKNLTTDIENKVPGFTDKLGQYHDFNRALETLKGKGYKPVPGQDYGSNIGDITEDIGTLVGKIGAPGTSGEKEAKVFTQFKTQLQNFEQKHPEVAQQIGLDTNEIVSSIKKQGDLSAIRKTMEGYEPEAGVSKSLLGTFTPRGAAYRGATAVGKTQQVLGSLYNAPTSALKGISDHLLKSDSKSVQAMGTTLSKAIESNNQDSINRVIFLIGQRPDIKDSIMGLLPDTPKSHDPE